VTKHFCPHCGKRFKKKHGLKDHVAFVHPEQIPAPEPADLPSVTCGECGSEAELATGADIYPHRRDLWHKDFWRCRNCGARCGCHKGTKNPLGSPAGPETRKARQSAHAAFDPIWRGDRKIMDRRKAYCWLSGVTGIEQEKCHIGMMTKDQALLVVKVSWEKRERECV